VNAEPGKTRNFEREKAVTHAEEGDVHIRGKKYLGKGRRWKERNGQSTKTHGEARTKRWSGATGASWTAAARKGAEGLWRKE